MSTNATEVSRRFRRMGMTSVVALIDRVEKSKGHCEILEVGSSSIGERLIVSMSEVYEAAQRRLPDTPFPFFYLGRGDRKGRRPPIGIVEHLELLAPVLEDASDRQRKDFDTFCSVLGNRPPASADVEGTDSEGHFRIPKHEYNRSLMDPTYEPRKIRIPRLSIDDHTTGPLNPNNG